MVAPTLSLLAPFVLPACVTQNVQFDPPQNYPPSIETPDSLGARHSLGEVIRLSDVVAADSDAGSGEQQIELRVEVRDPNVDETLRYAVFLNFEPTSGAVSVAASGSFPPEAGSVARRPPAILLPATLFRSRRCNRIELFVTGEEGFRGLSRTPVLDGNLGTATWFVFDDTTGESFELSDCRPWDH